MNPAPSRQTGDKEYLGEHFDLKLFRKQCLRTGMKGSDAARIERFSNNKNSGQCSLRHATEAALFCTRVFLLQNTQSAPLVRNTDLVSDHVGRNVRLITGNKNVPIMMALIERPS